MAARAAQLVMDRDTIESRLYVVHWCLGSENPASLNLIGTRRTLHPVTAISRQDPVEKWSPDGDP
jgi:hypothetical protein